MATLALTGRPGLQGPLTPYLAEQPHIPPSTWRFDPTGEQALEALDERPREVGAGHGLGLTSARRSAPPRCRRTRPPQRFWEGLAERREHHGFLICFDEVVTGIGRTGSWFAADSCRSLPDIIATAKGLGAGYAAIGAALCHERVYEAVANGSRRFTLGHTWDGAPLPCAVGLAVIDALQQGGARRARARSAGRACETSSRQRSRDVPIVREVRGHGYLLGVEYVDPRDGESFLPARPTDVAGADRRPGARARPGHPTRRSRRGDGYAGDQSLFAPPFTSTDEELAEMVDALRRRSCARSPRGSRRTGREPRRPR